MLGTAVPDASFETDGVVGNLGVEYLLQHLTIEVGVMRTFAAGRQLHHRDDDLMQQTSIGDALAAVDQIVDVVECVEVANRRHAVFLEHLGIEA